ncbi:hypothetical protein [Negadavirga shengliensis]|uniref:Uncharacterized protein n=1 Tax=Negadavirga shengliensis TaxID=1389218 RepID=A0ABV9SXS4_9BACT
MFPNKLFLFLIIPMLFFGGHLWSQDRGEVGTYKDKFIWTGTGKAFVPNYMMIDVLGKGLHEISETDMDFFVAEFMEGHGFNGVHVPVFGRWFHIEDNRVTAADSVPDARTFEKLEMIIRKVYQAGGSTYLWMWGDAERGWTSKSSRDGIMGLQERQLLDQIAEKLGPVKGWMLGYGFDLWEWVSEEELKTWRDYLWSKPDWNHLLAARASKNKLDQIYEGLDFSDYEYHKPWYDDLVAMKQARPQKPSFSGDRYRVRNNPPSKWPEKDYNEEETRRGLWQHTMAGGIGAIWGNLDGDGRYGNKEQIKCFFVFWADKNRFRSDMEVDNSLSDGFGLRSGNELLVYYKEETRKIKYNLVGGPKKVVAVDARKSYEEIELGIKENGDHVFSAPYTSDWVLAVEDEN